VTSALKAFDQVSRDLVGVELTHLWQGHGSAIFLEFGKLPPTTRRDGSAGQPNGEIEIGIEWSWRIEDVTSIICGSWSEGKLWEPSFDRIRGASVRKLSLFGRLPEIDLEFVNDHHLVSLATSEGQPQWHVVDRRGTKARWFFVRNGQLYEGDGSEVG
jgi:hypothetical protein